MASIADVLGAQQHGVRFTRDDSGRAEYALVLAARLVDDGRSRWPSAGPSPWSTSPERRVGEPGWVRGKRVLLGDKPS